MAKEALMEHPLRSGTAATGLHSHEWLPVIRVRYSGPTRRRTHTAPSRNLDKARDAQQLQLSADRPMTRTYPMAPAIAFGPYGGTRKPPRAIPQPHLGRRARSHMKTQASGLRGHKLRSRQDRFGRLQSMPLSQRDKAGESHPKI